MLTSTDSMVRPGWALRSSRRLLGIILTVSSIPIDRDDGSPSIDHYSSQWPYEWADTGS